MNKRFVLPIVFVLVAGAIAWYIQSQNQNQNKSNLTERSQTPTEEPNNQTGLDFAFANPKKSAHYETNTPAHGSVLAGAPINIVIDFNFDLAAPSEISITKDGKKYGMGETKIDSNKLSMRRAFDQSAPDGLYKVSYNACWPDKSCHDGRFEFGIDRSKAKDYQDATSQSEVTIRMSQIMFNPSNVKIKAGTKVTWVNDEDVEHYVNTDSHPAHTYYPAQNSRALKKGESYSLTFDSPGIYPYHCSAHAGTMMGNILVQ